MVARLSGLTTYSGSKPLSTSMPVRAHFSPLYLAGTSEAPAGRSRTWPRLDSTMYPSPRKLAILVALVGDSTITSRLPVVPFVLLAICPSAGVSGPLRI